MSKKLEHHYLFPIIAWMLVLGFGAYTMFLSYQLKIEESTIAEHQNMTKAYLRK